ncbi:MAG: hypothetical protein U0792_05935 [Gemmataceae bacterium]
MAATVLGEVKQVLGMVEGWLLDVVPRIYRKLEVGSARPTLAATGSAVVLAVWLVDRGGDRDGHLEGDAST